MICMFDEAVMLMTTHRREREREEEKEMQRLARVYYQ